MPDLKTEVAILKQQLEALTGEYHSNNFSGSQDFNKYSRFNTRLKVPHYATEPSTCEVGEIIEVSGVLKVCSATDTWSTVGTQT